MIEFFLQNSHRLSAGKKLNYGCLTRLQIHLWEDISVGNIQRLFQISILVASKNESWWPLSLRENCSYSEFFLSAFSRFLTEYGEILRISPYSVGMQENADQKNSEYGHFWYFMEESNEFLDKSFQSVSLNTAQKVKFSVKNLFSKSEQIPGKLRI